LEVDISCEVESNGLVGRGSAMDAPGFLGSEGKRYVSICQSE
jgi:hypothetical protein